VKNSRTRKKPGESGGDGRAGGKSCHQYSTHVKTEVKIKKKKSHKGKLLPRIMWQPHETGIPVKLLFIQLPPLLSYPIVRLRADRMGLNFPHSFLSSKTREREELLGGPQGKCHSRCHYGQQTRIINTLQRRK
jgi:hypothetical protein